jgi:phage terminase large subunit GpA-like protein
MNSSSAQRREVTDYDRAIAATVRDTVTPKPRLSVSQYAAKKRFIADGIRYSLRKTPFWAEPMDCMEPGLFRTVAIVGPGQTGKTTGPENFLLHSH